MSRTGGMTGAGGYGGISTLNQRNVRPRYSPHMAISITVDHMAGSVMVKCLNCKQEWFHLRGPQGKQDNTPARCNKKDPANKANRGNREYRP